MRPDILQAIALCTHTNAFLKSNEERPTEMLGHHPTFNQLYEILFERECLRRIEAVAISTAAWMRRLRSEDVVSIKMVMAHCPLDMKTEAEHAWGILTDGNHGLEIWRPEWKFRTGAYHEDKKYRATIFAERYTRWLPNGIQDLEGSKAAMRVTTEELAAALAAEHKTPALLAIQKTLDSLDKKPGADLKLHEIYPETWPSDQAEIGSIAARLASTLSEIHDVSETTKCLTAQAWSAALATIEATVNY